MITERQKNIGTKKGPEEKHLELRRELWPDLNEAWLWDRKVRVGFSTIPRTLPEMFIIMDELAEKGKPISTTYLCLWCRVYDRSMLVEIKRSEEFAYGAGFSGQRQTGVWKTRMKKLKELGFIDAKKGNFHEFEYVLIWNPYYVIRQHKDKIQNEKYIALFNYAQEIGATDLTEELPQGREP